jgi:hypothetical protein
MERSMTSARSGRWAAAACLALSVAFASAAPAQEDSVTVTILSPANGETVHDNDGNVAVRLEAGGAGASSRIRVLLDGRPYGPDLARASFTLQGIERGEHTLQAQLIDQTGKEIASSNTVKFHMWRASALFPGRKPQ